jgi:hypothetical protein
MIQVTPIAGTLRFRNEMNQTIANYASAFGDMTDFRCTSRNQDKRTRMAIFNPRSFVV